MIPSRYTEGYCGTSSESLMTKPGESDRFHTRPRLDCAFPPRRIEFLIVTSAASIVTKPCMSRPLSTVPAFLIVMSPYTALRCVPAGTPVVAADGATGAVGRGGVVRVPPPVGASREWVGWGA